MIIAIAAIVGILAGLAAGYFAHAAVAKGRAEGTQQKAKQILDEAQRGAAALRREGELQAKAEMLKAKEAFDQSTEGRRKEIGALEERVAQRESNLDRKVALLDKKERTLEERTVEVEKQAVELKDERVRLQQAVADEQAKLQQVAGMTQEEARKTLLTRMEKDVHAEAGGLIRRLQEQAKETAEREAQKIVASAVQRFSASHASEMMTSSVSLPSDDMKGRVIGREGRNIRALEAATGVNILIDDTPEAIVISGFDPVRREIARLALEQLIADGRIHPARIEEVVNRLKENMDETVRKAGEEAAYLVGIQEVDPELIRKVGRLKYRTSYSQNVLQHSIEVAQLMGVMAGELSLDVTLARRIGLFHDIGKALDHEVEGGHAVIGADLLKRHGELQVVVNAVAAHHEEVPAESLYALLAAAGDAISSSRPGARSETTDIYVKRLEKLEHIANGFDGVNKSYAIQAGREVRVIVEPVKIDDNGAMIMARNISKKIESDLQYPGQIRVTVIRETRAVEYAR
jgi:ribonucrease Y